jgi:exodeoxyribonuclease-3
VSTPGIAEMAKAAAIYKAERFSDHAPLTIHYHDAAKLLK